MRVLKKDCPASQPALARAGVWLILLSLGVLVAPPSRAEQLSLAPRMASNQEQVQWISGPAKANLGNLAEMDVPEGFRLTDAKAARALLENSKNPVPTGLVGILAPNSFKWWVVIKFTDTGYVKDAAKDPIDSTAVLATVREQVQGQNLERVNHKQSPFVAVNWSIEPAFDPATETVEWAFKVKTQSAGVVNHTVRLLGRRGVLDATAVQPDSAEREEIPLKQMMTRVAFKEGERYADYQTGDKVFSLGIAGLITGEDSDSRSKVGPKRAYLNLAIWGGAVGAGVLILLVFLAWRRRKKSLARNVRYEFPKSGKPTASMGQSSPILGVKASESGSRPSSSGKASRRRRVFNYHKFYTEMVLQVSANPYLSEPNAAPPQAPDLPKAQGLQASGSGSESNALAGNAQMELIASQKSLIDEQKRLLREQAKLIEEKSKLISEKTQILEKQAELYERDVL